MDCPPDWDLLALVRSCSSTTAAATTTTFPSPIPPSSCSSSSVLFDFSTPFTTTSFSSPLSFTTSTTTSNNYNINSTISSQSLSSSSLTVAQLQPQVRRVVKSSQAIFEASSPIVSTTTTTRCTSQSQRIKKRKNLMKKVFHVPTEGLSSDKWAWRKYGQKPIKGSPYPRGYYKCSSSKGCLARKLVERNKSNPKMFIVTYTSDHNHPMPTYRSTLAGSTRQKPLTSTGTPQSSPSAATLSPFTEKSESKTEGEEDMGGITELMLNDDFYVGFEEIDGGSD